MLNEIESQIKQGKDIEDVLEKYDWKKFENIIMQIFQESGFHTRQNFRFKTKKRYEVDVIAVKNNRIVCIDCKWWGRGRYKKSGLKSATIAQENRVKELRKFLKKNIIARNLFRITPKYSLYPLLVTLHDEDVIKENETFVIPAWKLNKFITELEVYIL